MRILFFYSEDDRDRNKADFVHAEVLHGLQMNFDTEWRFSLSKVADRYLCNVSHFKPVPRHMFSFYDAGEVKVSAIVGENGSGKTSFARMMHRLSLDPKHIRMVLVAEIHGEFHVWGNEMSVKFVAADLDEAGRKCAEALNLEVCNGLKYRNIHDAFKFVYYSPIYSSQHVLDTAKDNNFNGKDNFFYDVSTTGLMRHAKGGWRDFEYNEYWNGWKYLANGGHVIGVNPSMPYPEPYLHGVRVEVNRDSLQEAESYFQQFVEQPVGDGASVLRLSNEERQFLHSVCGLIGPYGRCKLFSAYVLYACAMCSWYGRRLGAGECHPTNSDLHLLEMLNEAMGHIGRNSIDSEKEVKKSFSKFWRYLHRGKQSRDAAMAWFALYDSINLEEAPLYSAESGVCYSFSKPAADSPFIELLNAHEMLYEGVDFLKIEPRPRISSGEWAMISIMSRINSLAEHIDEKEVVLFLDEAETAFHPNWQRQLVTRLIRFLQMRFERSNFHVIFATHSPILLSDIPSRNCVFLRRMKGNKTWQTIEEDKTVVETEVPNTFGANIYDLYRNTFFLKDGPVGELAKHWITNVLNAVAIKLGVNNGRSRKKGRAASLNINEWVDLIGDPVIHRYLAELKNSGLMDSTP